MAATAEDGAPLSDAEIDALFEPLRRYDGLVLAVSGGGDSTALMHLVEAWCRRRDGVGVRLVAVTVDHGLRPNSAAEAAAVASQAADLGIAHRTLAWVGPKPATGLQAAARRARYRLLADAALGMAGPSGGATAIVTAHTADDQAETLLMRLARGSGVDGLAAIPAVRLAETEREPGQPLACDVVRPLLTVPRRRLEAELLARRIPFAHDPSNTDPRFERVRVREALGLLEGLGVTREALARTATRMQAARAVLEHAADALQAASITPRLGIVYEVDRERLRYAPGETAVRVLRRVLRLAGGAAPPADLGVVEDACERIRSADSGRLALTLGGCIVDGVSRTEPHPSIIRVYREPDRDGGPATLIVQPGMSALWDGRFRVDVWQGHSASVEVGPLGADWAPLARRHPSLGALGLPAAALRGVPAFRAEGELLAVPLLAAHARESGDEAAAVLLAGPLQPAEKDLDGRSIPNLQSFRHNPARRTERIDP